MKTNKILAIILALITVGCSTLCGCGLFENKTEKPHASVDGVPDRLTKEEERIAVFAQGEPQNFWARNDRGNGGVFNCSFSRNSASIADGLLTLSLNKTDGGYEGAEYRSQQKYSYGFYSVCMKAAKCSGVVSSFFTYTGRPWDEIDIEFLGHDTTKIQLNYYTDGVGGHEFHYDLGFDGAEAFHEYAFDWQPDSITWYVDGKAVYRATENIPTTSANIMMNVWNVTDDVAHWAGRLDESKLPTSAQYKWIGYKSA